VIVLKTTRTDKLSVYLIAILILNRMLTLGTDRKSLKLRFLICIPTVEIETGIVTII
jgi:hypothetical protein